MARWIISLILQIGVSAFASATPPAERSALLEKHGEFTAFESVPGTQIFRGARPLLPPDYELLQSRGITTVLNLGVYPWEKGDEEILAPRYGIKVITVDVMPMPLSPLPNTINAALEVLKQHAAEPLYIHCRYGRDRTSLIIGLHLLLEARLDLLTVWESMKYHGFNRKFHIVGLYNYFYYFVMARIPASDLNAAEKILSNQSICGGDDLSNIKNEQECFSRIDQSAAKIFLTDSASAPF